MKKTARIIVMLLFTSTVLPCRCQVDSIAESIIRNTIRINRFDTIDNQIPNIFKTKKLLLIGELHGTAEPAEFVEYLVKNLVNKSRKIYVGFEIEPDELIAEKHLDDTTALKQCPFFKNNVDGRASQAWFNLLTSLQPMEGVHLFFFGLTKKQIEKGLHHADSLMYVNIKSQMLKDTGALYICLTGNYHNKLAANMFPEPMGAYLLRDNALKLSLSSLVSFNHFYAEGSGNFDTGNGTRLHLLNSSDYYYSLTSFRNFFSAIPTLINGEYNGVLFTYHVTASFAVK